MGTVPWVPTPALPTPIKVSVGKNDRVPADVAAKFDTTADGKLLWFQQPPIDVVPPTKPVHSIKYLEWKLSRPERTMDVEVGAAPAQTAAKAPQVEPGLLESVTKGRSFIFFSLLTLEGSESDFPSFFFYFRSGGRLAKTDCGAARPNIPEEKHNECLLIHRMNEFELHTNTAF